MGIAYSNTRFKRYKETLEAVEAERIGGTGFYLAAQRLNAFVPIFEANELVTIHQGMKGKRLDTFLLPKLRELVSGPDSYLDENPKAGSNGPRNTAFELSVIAHLASAGLAIEQHGGLADVVGCLGPARIIVECKRPQSIAGVERAISAARDQLNMRYKTIRTRPHTTGIIALDLTKVFNPELSVATDEPGRAMVSRIGDGMDSLTRRYRAVWDRIPDPRTAGVLYRYCEVAWNGIQRTITWNYKYGITPIANRSSVRVGVIRALGKALDRLALSDGSPMI